MKKIIISSSQLGKLNEAAMGLGEMPIIDVVADNLNDVTELGKEAAEKISNSGAKSAKIRVLQNGANPEGAIEVKGEGDSVEDQLDSAMDSSISSGMDKNATAVTTIIGADGQPVKEIRTFTKKQIDEARIKTLNENSFKMSKGEFKRYISEI